MSSTWAATICCDRLGVLDLGRVPMRHDHGVAHDRVERAPIGRLDRAQHQTFGFENHGTWTGEAGFLAMARTDARMLEARPPQRRHLRQIRQR